MTPGLSELFSESRDVQPVLAKRTEDNLMRPFRMTPGSGVQPGIQLRNGLFRCIGRWRFD
jgi:hypothetical protein